MLNTLESLHRAVELQRAGQLDEAEQLYRQVLAVEPKNVHALHLLGVIAHERGRHLASLDLISQAIALDPKQALFHANLSTALLALGRTDEAIGSLREVLRLEPERVKSHSDLGVLLAQQGRLDEAERCFQQVLRLAPESASGYNNLGNILNQQGRTAQASERFRQALEVDPNLVEARNNLASALVALGQADEAIAEYRQLLRLAPNSAEGHYNLGVALGQQGRTEEAIACYREALALQPGFLAAQYNLASLLLVQSQWPEALTHLENVVGKNPAFAEAQHLLGTALRALGRTNEARAALADAVRLKPDLAEAHQALGQLFQEQHQYGAAAGSFRKALALDTRLLDARVGLSIALRELGQLNEAAEACRQALEIRSDCAAAHSSLGMIRLEQLRSDEAKACQQEALRLKPDLADAHVGLGMVLESQGDFEQSAASFREAVRLEPDFAEAHNNLGAVLQILGRNDEAVACFDEVLRLGANLSASTLAAAHLHRGIARLLAGDFAGGWPDYEWRWQLKQAPRRTWTQPLWDGSPLAGRTIMLHPEQGYGDTFQFIRYVPLVKQRGGNVMIACPKSLIPLLSTCADVDQLCAWDDELPEFDVMAALMSLPGIFKTDLQSIPREVPYLSAAPDEVERWRDILGADGRYRVGINWKGNSANPSERFRAMPLTAFAPLAAIPGVRLISLQRGAGSEQLRDAAFPVEDLGNRLDNQGAAFYETAAVIKNLDLVITSDTAVAHLAGALAAPVWVPLSFAPDWRWLVSGQDTAWYPTMRLFRQRKLDQWDDVFARIATELTRLVVHDPEEQTQRDSAQRNASTLVFGFDSDSARRSHVSVKTAKVPGRRTLHFSNYDEVLADVHTLASGRTRQLGNWSLGQICSHLAKAMNFAIDGPPFKANWFLRLIGPFLKKGMLRGPMRAGFTLPKSASGFLPDDVATAAGVAALEKAIARFGQTPERKPNVVFGPMTRDEWDQLHLRHAELHLSFLVPE